MAVFRRSIPAKGSAVALLLVVLLAGCNGGLVDGFGQQSDTVEQNQQLRYVVQNEASSNQTVALTFTSKDGETVLEKSKTLDPGGVWIVSTFNVSALDTPVSVTIRLLEREYSNELVPIRSGERGSRLHTITDGGVGLYECNRNTTCWKQKAY